MPQHTLSEIISLVEWTQVHGYTLKATGHWVDDHNNTVAKNTHDLVYAYFKSIEDQERDRKPFIYQRDHRTHNNFQTQYRYQKTNKECKCYVCKRPVRQGSLRYWKPGYDICSECMYSWKKVGPVQLSCFMKQINSL